MYKVVLGCVRIASYSRSERNGNCRVGAPVGHAFDPFSLLSSHLAFRLHFHPPSRLDHRRKTTANESFSITLSQPPVFPFSSYLFPLSLYFRQRRSTLSRSSTALALVDPLSTSCPVSYHTPSVPLNPILDNKHISQPPP